MMRQQKQDKITYQSFKQTVDNIINAPFIPSEDTKYAMMAYMKQFESDLKNLKAVKKKPKRKSLKKMPNAKISKVLSLPSISETDNGS